MPTASLNRMKQGLFFSFLHGAYNFWGMANPCELPKPTDSICQDLSTAHLVPIAHSLHDIRGSGSSAELDTGHEHRSFPKIPPVRAPVILCQDFSKTKQLLTFFSYPLSCLNLMNLSLLWVICELTFRPHIFLWNMVSISIHF